MSGFSSLVLRHIPGKAPGLALRDIQSSFDASRRVPSLNTIRRHAQRFTAQRLVQRVRVGREIRYHRGRPEATPTACSTCNGSRVFSPLGKARSIAVPCPTCSKPVPIHRAGGDRK